MKPDRWREVDEVFEAALQRSEEERAQFLDEACAGDSSLGVEVEKMLRFEAQANDFIETPAFDLAARLILNDQEPVPSDRPLVPENSPGKKSQGSISSGSIDDARFIAGDVLADRYRIVASLGRGGMGEVYRADDLKLKQSVALKFLPENLSADSATLQRFYQEVSVARQISHRHVCRVYDVGEAAGEHFISMEFVRGEELARLLKRIGRLPHDKAVEIARQLCAGLAAIHERGVLHRDLKPANVMIDDQGDVRITDFGLAAVPGELQFATAGTPAYMSPEQIEGDELTPQSDIFSLGLILYEIFTGKRAFQAASLQELLSLRRSHAVPTSPSGLISDLDQTVERVIVHCLERDPNNRPSSALQVAASFPENDPLHGARVDKTVRQKTASQQIASTEEATRGMSSAEYVSTQIKRHQRSVIFVGVGLAIVTLAVLSTGLLLARRYMRQAGVVSPTAAQPFNKMKVTRITTSGTATHAAVSPDGKYVVHVTGGIGQQSSQLRHIATGSDKEIVPPSKDNYSALTFSRDGSYIYYQIFSDKEGGVTSQIPVLGGTPKVLGKDMDAAPTFSPDGKQVAFMRGLPVENKAALLIASVDGGGERTLVTAEARRLMAPASIHAWGPAWSPDGQMIAFALREFEANGDRYWRVMLTRVTDGTQTPFTVKKWSSLGQIAWLPNGSGMIIAAAEQEPGAPHQLWHVSYPGGETRRLTNDINNYDGVTLTGDASALVTVQSERRANIWIAPGADASRAVQIPSERNDGLFGIAWTPDGRIVYTSTADGQADISIMDADGTNRSKLTVSDSADSAPAVSPDGRYIVFTSYRGGASHIWRMDINGANPKQLTSSGSDTRPSFSPDSQWVFYSSTAADKRQVLKVPIDGGRPEQVTDYAASLPVVSPDGNFIACAYIDERITPRRYWTAVIPLTGGRPLKEFEFPRPYEQIVRWTLDGRALTYLVTSGGVSNIWRQSLAGDQPTQMTDFKAETIFRYDWSRDGKQLVLARGSVTSDVVLISDLR